jgi:perosamine synthetase
MARTLYSRAVIPVSTPNVGDAEIAAVLATMEDGWISSGGPAVAAFEAALAAEAGVAHAVACTSGTTAIHLGLAALDVGAGDEVLVPDFTMAASVFPILYQGATAVPVDVDPVTWTLDPDDLAAKAGPRSKAVVAVHMYGHACDMDAVRRVADERGLAVLEDAAEAHGGRYRGRPVGSLGNVAALSFYANKIVTTGEGGAVLTDDDAIAARCRSLRNMAFDAERRFVHAETGYNYRMTAMQAAVGCAQMERLAELLARKRALAARYRERLVGTPGLVLPPAMDWCEHTYWMFGVLIEDGFGPTRDELVDALRAAGVETRYFFTPIHRQPFLAGHGRIEGTFPVSDRLGRRGLYLPSGTALTDAEIDTVADGVLAAAAS